MKCLQKTLDFKFIVFIHSILKKNTQTQQKPTTTNLKLQFYGSTKPIVWHSDFRIVIEPLIALLHSLHRDQKIIRKIGYFYIYDEIVDTFFRSFDDNLKWLLIACSKFTLFFFCSYSWRTSKIHMRFDSIHTAWYLHRFEAISF